MKRNLWSVALASLSLLCVSNGLLTTQHQGNPGLEDVPVALLNDTEIGEYNTWEASAARLRSRLVQQPEAGLARRFLSLFRDPKPGIAYAPFRNDGGCKSAKEVMNDIEGFKSKYSFIRLYGDACDQVRNSHAGAKKHGLKLFLGVNDHKKIGDEVRSIASQLNGDWSLVDTVGIGNELLVKGVGAADALKKLAEGRDALKAAGYHRDKVGHAKIVLVETWVHAKDNPEICRQSDYCAVNFHPYFDPNHAPDQAGDFMLGAVKEMKGLMGKNDRIHICETGWPTKGATIGKSVPSLDNQRIVLKQIKDKLGKKPGELTLFSPFNDQWKKDSSGTGGAERFWGIEGKDSPV